MFSLQNRMLSLSKNVLQKFENRLTIKPVLPKTNFDFGFSVVKSHGREVIIFRQNFGTRSNLS